MQVTFEKQVTRKNTVALRSLSGCTIRYSTIIPHKLIVLYISCITDAYPAYHVYKYEHSPYKCHNSSRYSIGNEFWHACGGWVQGFQCRTFPMLRTLHWFPSMRSVSSETGVAPQGRYDTNNNDFSGIDPSTYMISHCKIDSIEIIEIRCARNRDRRSSLPHRRCTGSHLPQNASSMLTACNNR